MGKAKVYYDYCGSFDGTVDIETLSAILVLYSLKNSRKKEFDYLASRVKNHAVLPSDDPLAVKIIEKALKAKRLKKLFKIY